MNYMNYKQRIEGVLLSFPEVRWDRYSGLMAGYCTFSGWIDRDDQYKDFMVLDFDSGVVAEYCTSSAKLSAEFAARLDFSHDDCIRVEADFDIENMVRLGKP